MAGSDHSFRAIREFEHEIQSHAKPLVLWIGAGASAWAGYPTWKVLAHKVHDEFARYEPTYSGPYGARLLRQSEYPSLFSLAAHANLRRYRNSLFSQLQLRQPTPVYQAFQNTISKITPLHIITTNVDEMLERSTLAPAIQISDIEKCVDELTARKPFIGKIHGTISSVDSCVFTSEDYEKILSSNSFISAIYSILRQAIVVFFGYSLRDKYVLDRLERIHQDTPLFGSGPHFIVAHIERSDLPAFVKQISYQISENQDHRSAIKILDYIAQATRDNSIESSRDKASGISSTDPSVLHPSRSTAEKTASRLIISSLFRFGVLQTSQTVTFADVHGSPKGSATIGMGYTKGELPNNPVERSLHDIVVGLICFDQIYFPLSMVGVVHDLVGGERFWILVDSGALRFIHYEGEPSAIFPTGDASHIGSIGQVVSHEKPDSSISIGVPLQPEIMKPGEIIRRQIKSAIGKEKLVEGLFTKLEACVSILKETDSLTVPDIVRDTIRLPHVARVIGFSDALAPSVLPIWMRYPVLRIAHLVQLALACRKFNLIAAKLPFGGEILAETAFAVASTAETASEVASYVLMRRFNSDLGKAAIQTPGIFESIMKFRESAEGENLRDQIRQQIDRHDGWEFAAAVNASLQRMVPLPVLDSAADKMTSLMFSSGQGAVTPAVFTDGYNGKQMLARWRRQSQRNFHQFCGERGISENSLCPCGSGEQVRTCCGASLAR